MKIYVERGLSLEKKEEPVDPIASWTFFFFLLVATCAVLYFQIFAVDKIIPKAQAAEIPSMTDKQIYQEFDGQTKTLCKDYLKNHD